jgi:prepilin-type N-terminal cleavage/methylation domain-containing protein
MKKALNMNKNININKNKGFTLAELLVVGVILALLAAKLVSAMSSNIDEKKLDDTSEEMTQIATQMYKCGVANGGDYTNCNFTTLRSREYLDAKWGDGQGVNPFKGNYTTAVVSGNTNRFTITSTGIPTDAKCLQMIDRWTKQSIVAPTCSSDAFTFTLGTR